jgi:hypothetical protein
MDMISNQELDIDETAPPRSSPTSSFAIAILSRCLFFFYVSESAQRYNCPSLALTIYVGCKKLCWRETSARMHI